MSRIFVNPREIKAGDMIQSKNGEHGVRIIDSNFKVRDNGDISYPSEDINTTEKGEFVFSAEITNTEVYRTIEV